MDYKSGTIASLLKTAAIERFVQILNKIDGNKDLILNRHLISICDLILGFNLLKSNGVQKIYNLESTLTGFSSRKVCYVIDATVSDTLLVANSITADRQRGDDVQYWVVFVPHRLQICDECLEREGVYQLVTITDFPLGLIPLDVDLFSLESPLFFKNCFLLGEQSGLNHIHQSLSQLQALIGQIPSAYTKGKNADLVSQLLTQSRATKESAIVSNGIISDLIVVDRDEDYVSLLLSQLNYVGIIDEIFSIKCGKVEFGSEVTKKSDNNFKYNIFNDLIFDEIKDMSFSSVFVSLKEKGQKLKEVFTRSQNMNISAMKAFVSNELKTVQNQQKSLFLHISACETIMERKKDISFSEQLNVERNLVEGIELKSCLEFIEEGIIRQFSPLISLRLLALYSITQSGIASKDYKNLIKLFVQSYGHKFIATFFSLKKLGLLSETTPITLSSPTNPLISANMIPFLRTNDSIRRYRQTIKKLNLIPQTSDRSPDGRNPKDSGYVFGGSYIPLIARCLELVADSKNSNEEINKLLSGKFVNLSHKSQQYNKIVPKAVLIFMIGGITYAEVSALRFVAKRMGIKLIIATTALINGSLFLQNL